jgi:hypothetical protein
VVAVRDITASALDKDGNAVPRPQSWRVPLPPGTRARLSDKQGRLVLHKRGIPVLAWSFDALPTRVQKALKESREAARRKVESLRREDLPLPRGRERGLAEYTSLQRHFPAIYGLADTAPPESAGADRRTQARQLAGYLLLFDQWMANLCAQLGSAGDALSVERDHLEALRQSFLREPAKDRHELHHQRVQLVTSLQEAGLYAEGVSAKTLADVLESRDEAARRWQANLDHLLARVGEDFGAYLDVMRSTFGTSDTQEIGDRSRFLIDAPKLARNRGLAADLSAPTESLWDSDNVSGLEQRIARLLGIADARRRSLTAFPYDSHGEVDGDPTNGYRFRVLHATTGSILLSSATDSTTSDAARTAMAQTIERAQVPRGYRRGKTDDEQHYFNVVGADSAVILGRGANFADAMAMEKATERLMVYLREQYPTEGMYCIEGLALRLVDDEDRAEICTDTNCVDCSDDDPFSYRVHFVLPAYAGRFQDEGFRRFAEQTIREQTPAHLLPKVCWVGRDDMAEVEAKYRVWITLPASASAPARREATAELRAALAYAKNVYPARQLFDCTSEEELAYFVLGRAALGTEPRNDF